MFRSDGIFATAFQTFEPSLRLANLRHLPRGREAFERGREGGMGFGATTGRLIMLGESESGTQAEAASALLLRDTDGGSESFLGAAGILRIADEEKFALAAEESGVGPMLSIRPSDRLSCFDGGKRAFGATGLGFEVGKKRIERWRRVFVPQRKVARDRLSEMAHACFQVRKTAGRPT